MLSIIAPIVLAIAFVVSPIQLSTPILDVPEPLIVRMAEVAKGESGVDPTDPACVMRNRIIRGWNMYAVLNHFYARRHSVSEEELNAVRSAILFGVGCDERAYFQWSLSDVRNVRPDEKDFLYEANGNRYYSIGALRHND